MKSRLKLKIKKRLYRNIGITLLLLLSFYIAYKIYETQQRIKQRQRHQFRGLCIEGLSNKEEKEELNEVKKNLKDSIADLVNECVTDCKEEVGDDDKCKKACKPEKEKKKSNAI